MLKPIIQNHNLRVEGRDRVMPDDAAVTPDEHGNTRRMSREHEGFVSSMRNTRMDIRPIGYDRDRRTATALIPTTRKHDAPSSTMKAQCEPRSEGRLTRPTNGQPPHAHYRTSEATAPGRGTPHQRTMRPCTCAIE